MVRVVALGNNKVCKASLFKFLAKFGFNLTVIFTVRISILISVS